MTMVSVIIPVYNAETTVDKCVESIIFGNMADVEIILIDDFSSDTSWEHCCALANRFENVSAFRNDSNRGVSFTRNRGLKKATGEYVLFVDSDDWLSGQFLKVMLSFAESNKDKLISCGYVFIDETRNQRSYYSYGAGSEEYCMVERKDFFLLEESVMLQQLWNKLFHLDIIRKNDVRFDETLSMGEDFQFVLDYIKAGEVNCIVTIKQPLYYYVRHNNTSLMGSFASAAYDQAVGRFDILNYISKSEIDYNRRLAAIKNNYVYQIVRNKVGSRKDKIDAIELILQDGSGKKRYWKELKSVKKEVLAFQKENFLSLYFRLKNRNLRKRRERYVKKIRSELEQHNFTIISQNCIGGVFYHDMGLPFDSPTINLYFDADDYMRFVTSLDYYISQPLEMHWGEEYPIGLLADVKIYFMHYNTCSEALDSWNRRIRRIHWDRIIVLNTDRNGFGDAEYQQWRALPYPKLLFTVNSRYSENSIVYNDWIAEKCVPDLIPKREFYRNGTLLSVVNSIGKKR